MSLPPTSVGGLTPGLCLPSREDQGAEEVRPGREHRSPAALGSGDNPR